MYSLRVAKAQSALQYCNNYSITVLLLMPT